MPINPEVTISPQYAGLLIAEPTPPSNESGVFAGWDFVMDIGTPGEVRSNDIFQGDGTDLPAQSGAGGVLIPANFGSGMEASYTGGHTFCFIAKFWDNADDQNVIAELQSNVVAIPPIGSGGGSGGGGLALA